MNFQNFTKNFIEWWCDAMEEFLQEKRIPKLLWQ